MDKKQIKLFAEHLTGLAKILMQDAAEGDTQLDIANRLLDSIDEEFLTTSECRDIRKQIDYLTIEEQ